MRGSHYPETGMHLWSRSLGQWANDLSLFRSHLFENLVPEVTDFNIFLHYCLERRHFREINFPMRNPSYDRCKISIRRNYHAYRD